MACFFWFLAPAPCFSASETGEIIREISIEGLTRITEEELTGLIPVRAGEPLNMSELRQGIRRAFKKGIFLDIQALSEPRKDGIRLIYRVIEIPVVNDIFIEGNSHVPSRKIRKEFYYKKGENFREEYLGHARSGLLTFLGRKGFPDAEVTITATEQDARSQVDLRVDIREGSPLIVGKITTPDNIRSLIPLYEGSVFDLDRVEKGIRKIKNYYRKKSYINPLVGPYRFDSSELILPVEPGPRLEVRFVGNSSISSRKLKNNLTFFENQEVSDDLLAEAAERIRRHYLEKGYYDAQVAAGIESGEGLISVTFIIYEGKKVTLRKIDYTGTGFNPEVFKKVVPFTENKPYNDNLLDDSRDAIINFYNALGYLEAEVVETRKEFDDDGKDLALHFVISEGPQTIIRHLRLEGNSDIPDEDIRAVLRLEEGAPVNTVDITDGRQRILSLYGKRGYLDARVETQTTLDSGSASVTYRIEENRPSVIGKIILRGNNKTKPKIIKRELSFGEGDRFDRGEIIRSKRGLYNLGIFSEVSLDASGPGEEGEEGLVRDMLIEVIEAKAGSVEFTVGYGDYEKLRGAFDIRYRNLGGYNRQVGFRAELSSMEKRYIFNFREPWLFNQPDLPLKIFLIREEKKAINIETRDILYKVDKQSFIAGVEKELIKGLKAGLDYEYSYTDTKDVAEDVILSKEDTGTLGIGSLSPSLFYDRRDNLFNPTSGSLNSVVVKYASSIFLSETDFIKGTFQSSWYHQVVKPLVVALSFRGGVAYGFGESEELPLIERFFLGGRTTVRGYRNDTLGPKGEDGNPTGGNVFALTNLEFRLSLRRNFGLVAFLDAGNVWKTISDVDDELKYTVGAGLRYNTPVGPLRVDYGHKMNKEPGDSSGEVHFSIGHAF
ncbi:MAG: outer membrane protein assembly factor BamA [Nitrospiraceae bacterium]|nr:MAG: outer membrane protein assembly factor BamA [Nitrospiraceae bacterium]